MIFNVKHTANWEYIKQRKQTIINKNNVKENSERIYHKYNIGDKVLLYRGTENKYEQPKSGPHTVLKVHNNGTICLCVKSTEDTYNVRHLEPYLSETDFYHGGECSMHTSKRRKKH